MKISIMSMQRICNYGSFLQAYGLKKIIEELGHEVTFTDYRPGRPVGLSDTEYLKVLLRERLIRVLTPISPLLPFVSKQTKHTLLFRRRYNREFLPLLGIGKKRKYKAQAHTLVIGSDEVFNCLQKNPSVGFSPELFGEGCDAPRLISYGACFGNTTLEGLINCNKAAAVGEYLKSFNALSVRDENSRYIVSSLTGREPCLNLDPVLMYDFTRESIPDPGVRDYIVLYAYRGRISQAEAEAIKEYARRKNKKLICIGGYHSFCDEYVSSSAFEMLGYIKHADCVISDTFHGTVFSVINSRPFVTLVRTGKDCAYGNSEKLTDLLSRLKLEERRLADPSQLDTVMSREIDYEAVHALIQNERAKAREYLAKNL